MKIAFILFIAAFIVFWMIPAIRYITYKPTDYSRIRQNSSDRKKPRTTITSDHNDAKTNNMTIEEIEKIINTIELKDIL